MTILVNGEMAFDKNKNNSDKNTSAKQGTEENVFNSDKGHNKNLQHHIFNSLIFNIFLLG